MARKKSSKTKIEEVLEKNVEEVAEIFDLDSTPEIRSINEVNDTDDDLRTPETRTERYLAKIAGIIESAPEAPFTRLERYLELIAGKASEIDDKVPIVGKGINLLDNAYFIGGGSQLGDGIFPINQRWASNYSAGYTIDRWNLSGENASVAVNAEGVSVSNTSETVARFRQPIPGKFKAGTTLTLSVLAKVNYDDSTKRVTLRLSKGTALLGSYLKMAKSTSYRLYTITNTLAEDVSDLWAEACWTDTAPFTMDIQAVKLELGDMQTLARLVNGVWVLNDMPDFDTELMKCHRYERVLRTSKPYGIFGLGQAYRSRQLIIPIDCSNMRAVPSVTANGNFHVSKTGGGSDTSYPVTEISSDSYSSTSSLLLKAAVASGSLTEGESYFLQAANDSTANIILDANIF